MSIALYVNSEEEVSDLIAWSEDHPDDASLASRDAVAQWLVEFRRSANGFPSSLRVPAEIIDVLDALIEDWVEVLTAHNAEFATELRLAN